METTPGRIVVGVDGSEPAAAALRFALGEAARSGDEVDAILVWADPWVITPPPHSLKGAGRDGVSRLRQRLTTAVHRVRRDEVGLEAVRVVERVIAGDPAEVLVAESASARMLVVGSTGMSGLRSWVLGSVSRHCAEHARVPVVIVPPPERAAVAVGPVEEVVEETLPFSGTA